VHRAPVGRCATLGLRARPPPDPSDISNLHKHWHLYLVWTIRKSGSIPIRLASKAAWLIFERGIHSLRPAGPIARRHPSRCGRHRGVAVGVAEDFTTPLTSYP